MSKIDCEHLKEVGCIKDICSCNEGPNKIESKIKTPETIIKESNFLANDFRIFSKEQVIQLIASAQRQAIEATLEVASKYDLNCSCDSWESCKNTVDKKAITSLINSPELKVI